MDVTTALKAFVRTVERGSVTGAARDLAISQPAVSKHLANLEKYVRAQLLERSARMVRPTPEGRALYEASRTALATIEAAMEGVRSDAGAIDGMIRIHAPSCLGAKHLHPIVMDFQNLHPGVVIDLVLENRVVDLVYENFDIAVRYGRPEMQEIIIRRLGLIRRILVASPDYLVRSGPIDTLDQLSKVGIIATPAVVTPRNTLTLLKGEESFEIGVRPVLRTNEANVIAQTLLSGHAAGPVQLLLVSEELKSGKLVRILPDYDVKPTEVFLAYPSVRFMRPAVRAFADFATARLGAVEGIDTTRLSRNS